MEIAIVLFTRDLRLHDNPALHQACSRARIAAELNAHAVMNPLRQAQRFDPAGDYVRRHVPELSGLPPADVHTPWRLDAAARRRLSYPAPLIELT